MTCIPGALMALQVFLRFTILILQPLILRRHCLITVHPANTCVQKRKKKYFAFFSLSKKKRRCIRQSDKGLCDRREWRSHCVCPQELIDSTKKYEFLDAAFYKNKTCKSNLLVVYPSVLFHFKHVREANSNLVVLLY